MLQLAAGGGTSVSAGLNMALQVLMERRQRNPNAAVLLLSDGCDCSGGLPTVIPVAQVLRTSTEATVHTFGFGGDHDPALMSGIAEAGGGSFTFVVDLATVAEAFAACIGTVTDVVANRVNLTLRSLEGAAIVDVVTPFEKGVAADGGHTVKLGEVRWMTRCVFMMGHAMAAYRRHDHTCRRHCRCRHDEERCLPLQGGCVTVGLCA